MIKVLALITMLLDHIGQIYFPGKIIFNCIGRLAFPLFAWGIAIDIKLYDLNYIVKALVVERNHCKPDKIQFCISCS